MFNLLFGVRQPELVIELTAPLVKGSLPSLDISKLEMDDVFGQLFS